MKITSLYLKKYKKFDHSNIHELDWKIQSPVTAVIGSNGCGKSSLLRQLLPIAPIKSEFNKGGKRILTIEFNNKIYKLESDFTNPTKCHSFIVDNEELNIGKGADIQKELISQYFKITPLILSILSFSLNWCSTTPSVRKQQLYTLNPVDLSYIEKVHKYVKKQLTKCSNNLSLLHNRKQELEQKLLSKKEYDEIIKTFKSVDRLHSEIKEYTTAFSTLESQVKPTEIEKIDIGNFSEYSKTIVNEISLLFESSFIVDDSTSEEDIRKELTILNEKITTLEKSTFSLSDEISKYKLHKKHLSKQDKIDILQKELIEKVKFQDQRKIYKKLLNKYSFNLVELQYIVDNKSDILNRVQHILNNISNLIIDADVDTISKYIPFKDKDNEISYLIQKLTKLAIQKETIKAKIDTVSSRLKEIINIDIDNLCTEKKLYNTCQVYQLYSGKQQELEKSLAIYKNKLTDLKNIIKEINSKKDKLQKNIEISTIVNREYDKLINLLKEFSILKKYGDFYRKDYIKTFTNNISDLKIIFLMMINETEATLEYYLIDQEIKKIEKELDSLSINNNISVSFIDEIINNREKELKADREQLETLNLKLRRSTTVLNNLLDYQKKVEKLRYENKRIDKYIEYKASHYTKTFYKIILDTLIAYNKKVYDQYYKLINQIKKQDTIQDRLEHEVIKTLNEVKKQQKDIKMISKVLEQMSLFYMEKFINNFIKITNVFLSKICTYTLQIDYVKDIQTFDFRFQAAVGDTHIDEISTCSTGQQAMIDFAMSLAIIVIRELNEYPITIDEIDRTFDEVHKNRLLEVLNYILDNKIVSQIFIANHHAVFFDGFIGDIVVLNKDNITVPEVYNTEIKLS